MPRKKKNTIERPTPLVMSDSINKQYHNVFTHMNDCIDMMKGPEFNYKWDSRCFIPYDAAYVAFTTLYDISNIIDKICLIYHLANWRAYKQVYSFDSDFTNELIKSENLDMIPASIFRNLPYNSIYIEISGDTDLGVDGFFVTTNDAIRGENIKFASVCPGYGFDFLFIKNGEAIASCPLYMDNNQTIEDSINSYCEIAEQVADDNVMIDNDMKIYTETTVRKYLPKAVQLLLYICSIETDIKENAEQKQIYRKSSSISKPKDKLSEVKKWDVGYRIGRIIRAEKSETSEDSEVSIVKPHKSSIKRPHSRRGHFHHFWVGKHNTPERRLVVKWVAPLFVNAKLEKEIPAVIIKVEV